MQKDVFWKTGLITIVMFIIGLQIGIWLDSSRIDEVKEQLTGTELLFNDARIQTLYYENFFNNDSNLCRSAFNANLMFNDRIYEEGLRIEKYETVNRFAKDLLIEKRRYALLQTQFWINAMKIKNICNSSYTIILYVYRYDTGNYSSIEMPQKLQSATLLELKSKCGNKIMLSPIPLDLNLTAIDLIADKFNITETPAVIINDDKVFKGFTNLTMLEDYIRC